MKQPTRARVAALLLASLAAAGPGAHAADATAAAPASAASAPGPATAVVRQPRPFGYTIGDIATQRVLLAHGGVTFTPATLPAPERTSAWLERRAARIETDADDRRWLAVDYQVVNAPRALASVAVPAWDLAGAAGAPALRVPAATIGVAPLAGAAALDTLRPDRPAPAIATAPMQRQLAAWIAAVLATLVAWLAYLAWTAARDRRRLPFARALREVRARGARPAAAHLALHDAFDRTAGQVVHAGTLATLFDRAPYLRSQQPQIEHFYAQSAALFFAGGLPPDALSPQVLCRTLLRLQRQHTP